MHQDPTNSKTESNHGSAGSVADVLENNSAALSPRGNLDSSEFDVDLSRRKPAGQVDSRRLMLLFVSFLLALACVHLVAIDIWHAAAWVSPQILLWLFAVVAFLFLARHIFLVQFKGHSVVLKILELGAISILGTIVAVGVHEAVIWGGNQLAVDAHEVQTNNSDDHQNQKEQKAGPKGDLESGKTVSIAQHDANSSNGQHKDASKHGHAFSWWFLVRLFTIVPIGAAALYWMEQNREQLPERKLVEYKTQGSGKFNDDAPIVEHLIVPLTSPNWIPRFADKSQPDKNSAHAFFDFRGSKGEDVKLKLRGNDIAADIAQMEGLDDCPHPKFSNWQPLLRAIQPHQEQLKTVWLFGSSGEAPETIEPGPVRDAGKRGSAYALHLAMQFIQPYLKEGTEVRICRPNQELYFQKFEDMESVIESIVHEIGQENRERIVIDTTGGLKTASILGAMMTLKRTTRFQYVETIPPKRVYQFDMRIVERELGL